MKIIDIPRSGSVANWTSSRNRYGQYVRTRAIPVQPESSYQGVMRARLSQNAAHWRVLTPAQRAGWADLGASMIRVDSLGQSNSLTGFQSYCSVNNNNLDAGNAVVSDAPTLQTPDSLASMTLTLTAAAFSIAYTPTPLGAGERLFAYTSLQRSAGRSFEGDLRLLLVGAAAGASPLDVYATYLARFGIPIVGRRVFVMLRRYYLGFLSGPLRGSQIVA
jgi:hypothetical protein